MKAFILCFKAALLATTFFAVSPRAGVHYTGQAFVASCTFNVAASIGPNGVGYSYFDHKNSFSSLGMTYLGCPIN